MIIKFVRSEVQWTVQTDFLAYLLDIKQSGSLSKTAEHFYITYQSVRSGIKNLERQFGVKLIDCSYQGCVLTEAGLLVANYAERLFAQEAQLREALLGYSVQRDGEEPLKRFHIYVLPLLANKTFFSLFKHYQKRHIQLQASFQVVNTDQIANQAMDFTSHTILLGLANSQCYWCQNLEAKYKLRRLEQIPARFVLGVCQNSHWAKCQRITDDMYADIPIFTQQFVAMNTMEKYSNLQIVNGYAEQKTLIQSCLGAGVYTENEWRHYFANEPDLVAIPLEIEEVKDAMYIIWGVADSEPTPEVLDFMAQWKMRWEL